MTDTTTQSQRTPEEIERDIRATQEEMSRTVEQIEGELTPKNVINALFDKADQNGIDMRYLIDGARRNPLAIGMIGAGALWLISDADARPSALGIGGRSKQTTDWDDADSDSSRSAGRRVSAQDWHPDHRRYVDYMSLVERNTDEDDQSYRRRRDISRANYFMIEQGHDEDEGSFRQRLDAATEQARSRWTKATDSASRWAGKTSDSAGRLADGARQRGRTAVSDVQTFYSDSPLLSGLAAAFVGAVAGAMLPATRTEEQYIGGMGEQALGAASEQARKVGDMARQKKDQALDKIDETVGQQGQTTTQQV